MTTETPPPAAPASKPLTIISLTAENVKRLSAVRIDPEGSLVIIGGENGAGKSSCLDAIQYALGGDPNLKMPVRRGQERAKVVVDLGEIVVRRTFTSAGGTGLTVTDADGRKQSSPQALLDKLVGKLTFDPLKFKESTPKEQGDILRGLVGLDFTEAQQEAQRIYDERTAVNREAKSLGAQRDAAAQYPDAPKEEVSVAGVIEEQQKAAAANEANAEQRRIAAELRATVERHSSTLADENEGIKDIQDAIVDLQKKLDAALKEKTRVADELRNATQKATEAEARAAKLADIDLAPFKSKAATAEETNRQVRANKARSAIVKSFKERTEKAERLGAELSDLDSKRRQAISEAKYPIPGLSFDAAGGVTLDGIPFQQCSSAEQLRVSVAIGLAINPRLRVLLIRDGSLLDKANLRLVAEMAAAAGAQVWMERVSDGDPTAVIIEDGHVRGVEAPAEPEKESAE